MSGANSEPIAEHERFMWRALELAERGRGSALPNPMVGCVIVRDDEIVGEGWHERAGEPHAEARALEAAGDAKGATVYVTLEPCDHHGRTPPCSDALIGAGVRRVVVATQDPHPLVNGKGIKKLLDAGIEVVTGVLKDEAERLNEVFLTVHHHNRPFVLYKTAMTLDGKIATRSGQSRWITGPEARACVQAWRSEMDAVAVGVTTVLLDDPLLTSRLEGGRSPLKVIFDSVARTPVNAKLFEPDERDAKAQVIIYVTSKAAAARVEALKARGASVVTLPDTQGRPDVRVALADLKERGVSTLLLEGGGTLAWSFFEVEAVDRVAVFIGPKLLGGSGASPLGGLGVQEMKEALGLAELSTEMVESDILIRGRVVYRGD